MTPKEKAKKLIEKYEFVYIQNYTSIHEVKECAKIAVNEIIESCEYNNVESYNTDWWNKVKQEIDNF